MLRGFFLAVLLLLPGLSSNLVQGQTDPTVRPRRTQTAEVPTAASDRHAPSLDDNAEAKRLYKIGVEYGLAGLYHIAARTFEQVVKLKPDYADAYFGLGHAYYDLQQWEQAIDSLQRGLALKPDDKDSQDRLAHAQLMLERETGTREKRQPGANGERDNATGSPPSLRSSALSPANSKSSADDNALTKVYRVGPGDVLDVRLAEGVSAQSTLFTISPAGFLEHPDLSAPLPSSGLTVEEITARIADDLKGRPSTKNPNVSVAVQEYVSHRILVSGLVKEPGTKSLKREAIPLYVVVADAQPLPEAGRVSVLRNESNESYMIDLSEPSAMNMLVRPGDVVTLLENPTQFFYIGGEVKSPGEKTFRRGMTLTQAIIAAGGLTKNSKEARLARDNGKGFLVVNRYKLKAIESGKVPDPVIQPGDRITIID
jgi:protein involved in polysaccharide export with SLBB domain